MSARRSTAVGRFWNAPVRAPWWGIIRWSRRPARVIHLRWLFRARAPDGSTRSVYVTLGLSLAALGVLVEDGGSLPAGAR